MSLVFNCVAQIAMLRSATEYNIFSSVYNIYGSVIYTVYSLIMGTVKVRTSNPNFKLLRIY